MPKHQGPLTKIRDAWSKISAAILLLTAAAGIGYEIFHRGISEIDKNPVDVLIILVSILCGGLGVERLLVLSDIEKGVKTTEENCSDILTKVRDIAEKLGAVGGVEADIREKVGSLNKVKLLIDKDEMEEAACRLVKSCGDNDKIRATSQYFPGAENGDPLSDTYFRTISDRLKQAKAGSTIEYQVVLSASSEDKEKRPGKKWEFFETPVVSKRVRTFYAKGSWPFELLIGGKSMNIAFTGGTECPAYEMAIEINDENFVKRSHEWFLEMIRRDTIEAPPLRQKSESEAEKS
jgi:hypothetical protein